MTDVRDLWYRGLRRVTRNSTGCGGLVAPGCRSARSVTFEDRSAGSGLEVVLHNAASPVRHQIETIVGGVAALDYDGDGLLDLFFTNGAAQPGLVKTDAGWWNRLYRNRGNGVFEDVTAKAGVRGEGFSIGAAAADYDNDGYPDLFVAGVKHNTLYHNRGDGTFEEVTAKAGIHDEAPVRGRPAGSIMTATDSWICSW